VLGGEHLGDVQQARDLVEAMGEGGDLVEFRSGSQKTPPRRLRRGTVLTRATGFPVPAGT